MANIPCTSLEPIYASHPTVSSSNIIVLQNNRLDSYRQTDYLTPMEHNFFLRKLYHLKMIRDGKFLVSMPHHWKWHFLGVFRLALLAGLHMGCPHGWRSTAGPRWLSTHCPRTTPKGYFTFWCLGPVGGSCGLVHLRAWGLQSRPRLPIAAGTRCQDAHHHVQREQPISGHTRTAPSACCVITPPEYLLVLKGVGMFYRYLLEWV